MGDAPVIGFIGLGYMGLPMAQRIIAAGHPLVVWNRSAAKAEPLAALGAAVARDPADLARRSDIVITCLADDKVLETVLFGEDGVASAGGARLLVDATTVDPRRTRELADRLDEACGMRWVDAPVSGGPAGARAGTLATMAGGGEADVEAARAAVMAYSARLSHLGPVGAGQTAKACNQIMFFGSVLAVSEAFALARRFGVDPQRLPEALAGGFADSSVLREYARAKAAGERGAIPALLEGLADLHAGAVSDRFRGKLGLSMKDIAIVRALGEGAEVDMPAMALTERLVRALHDDRD